jgi:outer membrane protein
MRCLLFTALVLGTPAAGVTGEPSTLRWSIGGGLVASPKPYVGAETETFPIPVVRIQYGRWFVQGIRGGYELLSAGGWSASALAQARFQGLSPKDSAFLEGMEARRTSLDGGVEILYRGRPLGFRAAALTDVLGRSNGQELLAQATTGAPLGKKLLLLVDVGPKWETARRVNYYYGVRPEEATPERPAYRGEGTLSWELSVSAMYRPRYRWSVFASWNRTALGDAIRRSPTVARKSISGFVLFVTRDF